MLFEDTTRIIRRLKRKKARAVYTFEEWQKSELSTRTHARLECLALPSIRASSSLVHAHVFYLLFSYLPKFETTRGPVFLLSSKLLYATYFRNLAENRSSWPSWTLTWSKSISPYNLFFLRIQILNKAS